MSLHPESELPPRSPSPSLTDYTVDSMDDDQVHSRRTSSMISGADRRYTTSLPPLRDMLKGVDAGFNVRHTPSMRPYHRNQVNVAHAEAREEALARALQAAHIRKQPQLAARPCAYNMGPLMPSKHAYHGDHDHRFYTRERDAAPRAVSHGQPTPPYHYTPYSCCNHSGPSPYTHVGHPRVVSLPALDRAQSIDSGYSSTRDTTPVSDRAEEPAAQVIRVAEPQPSIQALTKKRKAPQEFEENANPEERVVEAPAQHVDSVNVNSVEESAVPKTEPVTAGRKSKKAKSSGASSSADSDDGKPAKREYFSPEGVKLEVIEIKVNYDPDAYLKYIEPAEGGQWRCTWQTMEDSRPVTCKYPSKKHLVKRHIEATHMKIKRFKCSWCEKTFTQRSNVAGCHLNTHSGEAPHECDFCTDHFKDPSKRHKHMRRDHKYRPIKERKKFKSHECAQGKSAHESITPWVVQTSPVTDATTSTDN
ncbi:hypothetical protein DENSPDRAFT_876563 [Dentipellis sp. KUC8613]|nr:hypothetical protein DENSPDRAFT_876563 [Dentipellis sp. KUC8613]